jgi:hypothetical protein
LEEKRKHASTIVKIGTWLCFGDAQVAFIERKRWMIQGIEALVGGLTATKE